MGAALSEPAEPGAALPRLASLVAASAADLCLLDVVMPDGVVVRVAAQHRDPAHAEVAWELRRFPPELDDPADPFGGVARTGEALYLPEVPEGWLEASVGDADHRELLRSLGLRSLLAVPLAARGGVHGVLTLASGDASRRFDADDLALAEELGRRAAQAAQPLWSAGEARRTKGIEAQFIAAMTHEFRTPVHIASMFAELLVMGVPEPIPPAARAHAEQIRTAAQHLDHLVQQILTLSRLGADREQVRVERVDLVELARETAGLIEPLARQKGIGFGTDLPEEELFAHSDANKVRQILFNLLGNAVKFTDTGEVGLRVRREGGHALFEVRDTGIGIAAEHREKIFEPFWQADRESVPGSKGTGLGLGIVQRLVHLLEGEVTVESVAGSGSVFRVALPLRRREA